eukprot:IDg2051t1
MYALARDSTREQIAVPTASSAALSEFTQSAVEELHTVLQQPTSVTQRNYTTRASFLHAPANPVIQKRTNRYARRRPPIMQRGSTLQCQANTTDRNHDSADGIRNSNPHNNPASPDTTLDPKGGLINSRLMATI